MSASVNRRAAPQSPGRPDAGHNWNTIKSLLCERIRRRFRALQKLSDDDDALTALDERLTQIGDDADKLWGLDEQLEQQLERAFAPRARRVALSDSHASKD